MKRDNKELYKTRLRDNQFAARVRTQLWVETPSLDNPYVAEQCRCHGYELFELIEKRSFIDVLYLLFQGELPSKAQAGILETLMIGLINPGPRHPATRAAMSTGIGKTDASHILPIAQLTLGGPYLGGKEVVTSMQFLNKNCRMEPMEVVNNLIDSTPQPAEGDWHIAPGFGTRFGGLDLISKRLAITIARMPGCGKILKWSTDYANLLEEKTRCSWLSTGLTAAVLSDLGFHPKTGAGLFQLINAPGLLAHGLEMSNKPINAMPFIDNEHYFIDPKSQKR